MSTILRTKDIKGVQIAKTGRFQASTGPVTFTTRDFDNMAAASKELLGKVAFPLKLGHNDGQELVQEDGLPAAGWIENVRRQGEFLMADFMRVPLQIAEIMKAGGFRKRSIEAFRNVEFAGKRYPMVLTGTALLGEDLPAVDSLDDIEALYQAAKIELPGQEDTETELILMIMGIEAAPETLIIEAENKGGPMELKREDIVKALGLTDDVSDDVLVAAITKLKKTQADMDVIEAAKVAKVAEDARVAAESKETPGDPKYKELEDKIAKQEADILTLQNNTAKDGATLAADTAIKAGRFVPGVRPQLIILALSNGEEFKKLVDATPVNTILARAVIGGDGGDAPDLGKYEPAPDQTIFLSQTGVTREEFILQAMEDSGDQVSEPIKAKLRETIKASKAT